MLYQPSKTFEKRVIISNDASHVSRADEEASVPATYLNQRMKKTDVAERPQASDTSVYFLTSPLALPGCYLSGHPKHEFIAKQRTAAPSSLH